MNNKKLFTGAILLVSFLVILFLIFMPIFGEGRNGLEYSDDFFNSMAKGSSNYMPEMRKLARNFVGQPMSVQFSVDTPFQANRVDKLYLQAGAQVKVEDAVLKISGDLGQIMLAAVDDAEAMFNNQGDKLQAKYQYASKESLKNWWVSFNKLNAALTKKKEFKQAKAIDEVMKRALEPAYNFYGITAASVGANAVLLIFMLVFYVVYTLWYGYGIFEIFEGIGLGMEKAATKEEV